MGYNAADVSVLARTDPVGQTEREGEVFEL